MKRVTHTPFHAPTTVIGRDVDITLAITNGLAERAEREARKTNRAITRRAHKADMRHRRTVNTTIVDLDAPEPRASIVADLARAALAILARWGVDTRGKGGAA
jgi:hypothetical protein